MNSSILSNLLQAFKIEKFYSNQTLSNNKDWLLSNLHYNNIDNSKSGVTTLKTENGELLLDSQILACQQMHFSCKF